MPKTTTTMSGNDDKSSFSIRELGYQLVFALPIEALGLSTITTNRLKAGSKEFLADIVAQTERECRSAGGNTYQMGDSAADMVKKALEARNLTFGMVTAQQRNSSEMVEFLTKNKLRAIMEDKKSLLVFDASKVKGPEHETRQAPVAARGHLDSLTPRQLLIARRQKFALRG